MKTLAEILAPFCNPDSERCKYPWKNDGYIDASLILRLATVFGDLKLYPGERLGPIGFTFKGGDGLFMPLMY